MGGDTINSRINDAFLSQHMVYIMQSYYLILVSNGREGYYSHWPFDPGRHVLFWLHISTLGKLIWSSSNLVYLRVRVRPGTYEICKDTDQRTCHILQYVSNFEISFSRLASYSNSNSSILNVNGLLGVVYDISSKDKIYCLGPAMMSHGVYAFITTWSSVSTARLF